MTSRCPAQCARVALEILRGGWGPGGGGLAARAAAADRFTAACAGGVGLRLRLNGKKGVQQACQST